MTRFVIDDCLLLMLVVLGPLRLWSCIQMAQLAAREVAPLRCVASQRWLGCHFMGPGSSCNMDIEIILTVIEEQIEPVHNT